MKSLNMLGLVNIGELICLLEIPIFALKIVTVLQDYTYGERFFSDIGHILGKTVSTLN